MEAEEDAVCAICLVGDSLPENQILFCDGSGCTVVVHQECYGVSTVPEGDWLCASCAAHIPANTCECVLCPVRGGPMKALVTSFNQMDAVVDKGRRVISAPTAWAHVSCVIWIPETFFGDEEGVDMIQVPAARASPRGAVAADYVEILRVLPVQGAVAQLWVGSVAYPTHTLVFFLFGLLPTGR